MTRVEEGTDTRVLLCDSNQRLRVLFHELEEKFPVFLFALNLFLIGDSIGNFLRFRPRWSQLFSLCCYSAKVILNLVLIGDATKL